MNVSLQDFKTGWFGLEMGLTDSDIELLIEKLHTLKREQGHFHLRRSEFPETGGLADVEIFWTAQSIPNMVIE